MAEKEANRNGATLRIVVCLKQVRHRYARTGLDPKSNYLAPEDEVLLVSPHDEAALNLAVNLKAQMGGGELTALTLSPIFASDDLERCLALGADAFYQLDGCPTEDTWSKSLAIAGALQCLSPTLVLCGLESLDGRNGQMGAFLARHLGLPFISAIQKMDLTLDQMTARVQRAAGQGEREIVSCHLPAVLSVDAGAVAMRLATVPGRRKARTLVRREFILQGAGKEAMLRVLETLPPRPRCKSKQAPDANLGWYQRVEQLLSSSSVDKQVRMLQGDPAQIAKEIVEFLVEREILEPASVDGSAEKDMR